MKSFSSKFAQKMTGQKSGIEDLMEDLGIAMANADEETCMLGGGNPAHIPAMEKVWRDRMAELLASADFDNMLGNYSPPQGDPKFLKILAEALRERFGWEISENNIAVTNGGQTAFFYLFNLLAGQNSDGRGSKVLLPLVPEYIGYSQQGLSPDVFVANKPRIDIVDEHTFKYGIDFDALSLSSDDDIGAVCLSRPTNPTGNVITDAELQKLSAMCRDTGKYLIIDNAYGAPFPNIIFEPVTAHWDQHVICTMSLSKLGLPGTRTGIVVANEDVIRRITSLNAIVGLANNNVGQGITQPLIESGEIFSLSKDVVQPFYQAKAEQAKSWIVESFGDRIEYYVHKAEGALFLWIWFKDLPVRSEELYQRLKKEKVLIVPGHHFFFGIDEPEWRHQHECIRLNYAMDERTVKEGIARIAKVVQALYS